MTSIKLTHGEQRKSYVRKMFNSIARRYDLLNHLLSFGIDYLWRRKAIQQLNAGPDHLILDLATGTGDLAIETINKTEARVIGADISINMLKTGQTKSRRRQLQDRLNFVNGDGEQLPFGDAVFGGTVIAFGIRNMGHIDQALTEIHRVLKDSGQLIILEFSLPQVKFFQALYLFYFNHILPRVGRMISKDKEAYTYLPVSVSDFPSIGSFAHMIESAGFGEITYQKLLSGVAVIYKAHKNSE
ncbi:MAG: bifunctional demethylmenaquinone methyltransferase/2-methoxy-6-polyprenyl-1,4-benzoquinol methylase UbiE [Caldithrix sp.]|nr:bifunctional demethylmenaquinone methyltransferase/2-methoxy-6-polyprenyl-1,4-benzoquinol methylase UbiE [Caldithrix sp.]